MAVQNPAAKIRNLGVAAHIDAGKTTVTERMLFYSHGIHRMGTVDDGNTTTDFLPEERARGITIQSAAVSVKWNENQFNLIDTPGHVDFTAEVERSLRVLDGAVIVLCGNGGVEAQSETVWRQADRYNLSRIVFVNKLDRLGASFDRVVGEVKDRLGGNPLVLTFPKGEHDELDTIVDIIEMKELRFDTTGMTDNIEQMQLEGELLDQADIRRSELIEQLADVDDEIAELYLGGEEIANDALKDGIRRATLAGLVQPTLCGAALRNIGVQTLMDAVGWYLPSPRDIRSTKGFKPGTEVIEERKHYADQPFSGYIFKTVADEHTDAAFMRIYSGTLKENSRLLNTRVDRREKITHIYLPFADERHRTQKAVAGDIVELVGLKFSSTGDTLADSDSPIAYEAVTFPDPVVSMAIEPASTTDRDKLDHMLERIVRCDPTFFSYFDEDTGQQIIAGMGELHLEVRRHELEAAGINIKVGEPRVSYRETIRTTGTSNHTVETQIAGKDVFARVKLTVEPFVNNEQGHVVVESELPEGALSEVFLDSIREAARDAASGGVLRGDPLINIKIIIQEVEMRDEDFNTAAFSLATARGFSEAATKAGLLLLEPVMRFEVVCPEEFLGAVLKDLQMRGAVVGDMEMRGNQRSITGSVALSRMFEYASQIRSLTQGRGSASLEPAEYGEVSKADYDRLLGDSFL